MSLATCIDKGAVQEFFDRLAPTWDEHLIIDPQKMDRILDAARIGCGTDVLDIACGTGVMIDFYLHRGARHVTAIDLSQNMTSICKEHFEKCARVDVVLGDASLYDFGRSFDAVMVFNAFPHFADQAALLSHLAQFVRPGGTLSVAHDMGRKQLDAHHTGVASAVSCGMIHEDDLVELLPGNFKVVSKVSEPGIFYVSAERLESSVPFYNPAVAQRFALAV